MARGGSHVRGSWAVFQLLLALLAVTVATSACVPEDLGGGLDIVNETDQRLYIYQTPISPNGGRWRYEISTCSDSDLTVRTKDGTVIDELTEEWCPGQLWTVTGDNEDTLASG